MATQNVKSVSYGGNTYKLYPSNLKSESLLTNQAQDATETAGRVYPVRMDANGELAVNVPWESSTAGVITVQGTITNTSGSYSGTFSDSRIADDMKCIELEVGTPGVFGDEISVVTGNGTVTISCNDVSGTSTFTASFIASVLSSTEFTALDNAKINKTDIVNNLTTDDATKVLSAAQGKTLNGKLSNIGTNYSVVVQPQNVQATTNTDLVSLSVPKGTYIAMAFGRPDNDTITASGSGRIFMGINTTADIVVKNGTNEGTGFSLTKRVVATTDNFSITLKTFSETSYSINTSNRMYLQAVRVSA